MPGKNYTEVLERLADAALQRADVLRRALWMELAAEADASALERPVVTDERVRALAAAFAELLAAHQGHTPPSWTIDVGPLSGELFLTERSSDAARERLRAQSPLPLRRRNMFAPAKYVQLV